MSIILDFWFSRQTLQTIRRLDSSDNHNRKVAWTKNQIITNEGFLPKEITWNGKDDFGNRIEKGVYIYELGGNSNLTNTKTKKFEKLVIPQ